MRGSRDSHLPTEGPACPIILSRNPSGRSGSLEDNKLPPVWTLSCLNSELSELWAVWTLSPVMLFEVSYYYGLIFCTDINFRSCKILQNSTFRKIDISCLWNAFLRPRSTFCINPGWRPQCLPGAASPPVASPRTQRPDPGWQLQPVSRRK